jgi:bifunctional DNA-binding transcriptional regulator/antitoxin component of YhaV-PrlF toxin-antitoxin module
MTKKTLLPTNDLYLQFTDEEIQELGWEAGQKLEVKQHDDGSIELRPYVKVELDMEEWPREMLEMIIKESLDQDISVNDVINNLLKQSLKDYPAYENFEKSKELLLEKATIDPNFTNNDTSIASSVPFSHKEELDTL